MSRKKLHAFLIHLDWLTTAWIRARGRVYVLPIITALALAACQQSLSPTAASPAALPATRSEPAPVALVATPTQGPIAAPSLPPPTAEPLPTATVGEAVTELSILAEDVQLFPVPKIITGDRVTFMVQPTVPDNVNVESVSVDIFVDGELVSAGTLDSRNWDGKAQGVYEWVWDTTGRVGRHDIRVALDAQDRIQVGDQDPLDNEASFNVRVGGREERPLEERDASWITAETDCCTVHAITRTAAYRDFPELLAIVDSAVSEVSSRINELPREKIAVYFIDRTIGQGGYAGTEMVVVYNDRPYIGGELYELLKHEAVHIIDRQFAPQRTELLGEGVAVWASGGHYEAQDLQRRVAALVSIDEYIPLAELANNYYPAQHEIGYLEAGALVDYLVARYGWPDVREFYSNTSASDGRTAAEAIDSNLRRSFGISLAQLESEWLADLRLLEPTEDERAHLMATIRYHDTARHYQQQFDRTAYFRTAWLPHPDEVITQGNAADYLRRPESEFNLTVEVMLRTAYEAMRANEFERVGVILDSIDRFLETESSITDPLFSSYQGIVHTALAFGYDPQRVDIDGVNARVVATTASGHRLINLDLELQRDDWILLSN